MRTSKQNLNKKTTATKKYSQGTAACNICGTPFRTHSSYDRFCNSCRHHSKVFMFSDWLPEAEVNL